jgi:hypothetical protein
VAPDDLIDTLARAKSAMADMPLGDLDLGGFHWDAERIRVTSQAITQRGDLLHTVAAVADGSGEIAGISRASALAVVGERPSGSSTCRRVGSASATKTATDLQPNPPARRRRARHAAVLRRGAQTTPEADTGHPRQAEAFISRR